MPNLKAIVFDLDDTLYLEEAYVKSGFKAVARYVASANYSAAMASKDLNDLFDEGIRGNTFNIWMERFAIDESLEKLINVYRGHAPTIAPFHWVHDQLTKISKNYLVGLITDGYVNVQQRKFAALGVDRYFDAVVFSDEFGRERWKPHPRPYETILTKLNVSAEQAIYIGDNPQKDFLGASRVGMHSARLRHPGGLYFREEPKSRDAAPDIEIEDPSNLHNLLSDIEKKTAQ